MHFFRFFQSLVLLKYAKNRIRIICDYSSNMAVTRLKIRQKLLQIKYFHIMNMKFDFFCRQILHYTQLDPLLKFLLSNCQFFKISKF